MTPIVSSDAGPGVRERREGEAAVRRRAAIDVGTHSVRLVIVEVDDRRAGPPASRRVMEGNGGAASSWREVYRRQKITRLGEGWQVGRPLHPEARKRTLIALESFAADLKRWGVTDVQAVATGVVREATDGEKWVAQLRDELRLPVRVISGEEEAELAFRGVVAGLQGHPLNAAYLLVLDVGGGSTEWVWGSLKKEASGPPYRLLWRASLPLGAVRLTEGFLVSDPPTDQEWERLQRHLRSTLEVGLNGAPFRSLPETDQARGEAPLVVGVGGTATSLAAMDQALPVYRREKVHGYRLPAESIARWAHRLRKMPLAERQQVSGLQPQRAAVAPAGAAILAAALAFIGAESLVVSEFDLLEGILASIDP